MVVTDFEKTWSSHELNGQTWMLVAVTVPCIANCSEKSIKKTEMGVGQVAEESTLVVWTLHTLLL